MHTDICLRSFHSYSSRYESSTSPSILFPPTLVLKGRNAFLAENCKLSRYFVSSKSNQPHRWPSPSSQISCLLAGPEWIIQPTTSWLLKTTKRVSWGDSETVGCRIWISVFEVSTGDVFFLWLTSVVTQGSHIQTRWSGPLALSSTGYLSCPLWRGKPSGKRSAWKWRKAESLHHDNQLLPSLRVWGSKPGSLCQPRLSRIKPSWHLVPLSSLP